MVSFCYGVKQMSITKTGKMKNGKQQYRVRVTYKDSAGRFHQKERTAYGRDDAVLAEMQIRSDLEKSTAPSGFTVKKLYGEYIKNKRHEVRETTLDKTDRILKAKILPYLGACRLDNLNNTVLQNWKNDISELGLSVTTRKNIYGEFRTMLNYAVKMGYLQSNPLIRLGNFKDAYFEVPKDKMQYYTAKEFKKFIATAKSHTQNLTDWGYYVFFKIAFYTGMRKGEINALKWSDIDGNIIHVRRSIAQKIKGKKIVETPPKNKSSYRDLQMPKPLIKILDKHKKRCEQADGFSDDYRICGGADCLSDTGIANRNELYAKQAGLPRIRIHDFRHSHASLLANEGINIQEIARRLGHANIEMTWNTYSHLYPREEERAVRVLDKI